MKTNLKSVALCALVFAVVYWFLFYTNNDFGLSPDMAMPMSLSQSDGDSWCKDILCGIPSVGSFIGAWQYNPILQFERLLFGVQSPYGWIAIFFLIAAVGIWMILRGWVGVVFGFLYAFHPTMVSYASVGHGSKLMSIAFLPWILYSLINSRWVLLAVVFYLQLVSMHVQIIAYGCLLILFWMIYSKKLQPLVSVLVGAIPAIPLYAEIMRYTDISARAEGVSWQYATQWSFPPQEILSLLSPFLYGFGNSYRGVIEFIDAPLALGLAVIAFAACGNPQYRWFLWFVAGFSLLMSFGKYLPAYGALYIIPGFDKFRCPMLIQTLMLLSLTVLAGFGAKRFKYWWIIGICAVIGTVYVDKLVVKPVSGETIENYYQPNSAVEFLKRDTTIFRVLPLDAQNPNWYAYHHIESALGNVGVKPKLFMAAMDSLYPGWEYLDAANVKYVLSDDSLSHPYLKEVSEGVYLYTYFKERAFVRRGTVNITHYEADRVVMEVDAQEEGILFYSCAYNPQWTCTIDGMPAKIFVVNVMFSGVYMNYGRHVVEFRFKK